MVFERAGKWIARVAAASTIFIASSAAFAQGCAMCATSASAAKASALQALRSGILILLVPPLLMFVGIFVVAFRSRSKFNDSDDRDFDEGGELNGRSLRRPPAPADPTALAPARRTVRARYPIS